MIGGSARNPASSAGYWSQKADPILTIGAGEVNNSWGRGFYDGSTFHMLYSYKSGGKDVIGHATASDPEGTWTKDAANNPILSTGSTGAWDAASVYVSEVWKEGGTWYVLYMGADAAGNSKIGLASGSSLTSLSKSGSNPVLSADYTWEKSGSTHLLDCGPVWKVGSTYYFAYGTWMTAIRSVGMATSTNLTSWTKPNSTPIFTGDRYTCGGFVRGSHYYLMVSHYTAISQESDIELWRSLSPEFTNPELVRIVAPHNPGVSWQAKDFEMLSVIASDIEKITYPNNKLYILTSGSDVNDVWSQGLIVESDIDAALEFT